jgi:hypothetical protein
MYSCRTVFQQLFCSALEDITSFVEKEVNRPRYSYLLHKSEIQMTITNLKEQLHSAIQHHQVRGSYYPLEHHDNLQFLVGINPQNQWTSWIDS